MSGWFAGAASKPFPVATGTPMAGYMARTEASTGVLDELAIGALVLKHGNTQLAIVAADIAAVDEALVTEVANAAGLDRSELVLCASHTHSGPAGVVSRLHPADEDRLSPELRAAFVTICVKAIAEASAQREPADLLFGQTETSGLAANRNDPAGPFDPRLSVLATRTRNGVYTSILVHFACHPTILGADNLLISADFPGALRRALKSEIAGQPPVILFANGAAGDVSTRFTRISQDYAEVERVGVGLAAGAVAALANARPIDGPIRYERQTVILPPRTLTAPSELERVTRSTSAAERRKAETRAQGAALLTRLVKAGPYAIRSTLDVEVWCLGDLALVAIPGELFASLGARITGAFPTLGFGYANGYAGYLVDESAYGAGTYEALASPFAPGAGELVAEAARALVDRVRTDRI
jgi:neutral ceramidase